MWVVIRRPVLRYHGGKFRLARWIISHFPPHRIYVEPFGGAGSVLLKKQRAYSEIYNDLDGEIVNVFRVLRDADQARELVCVLRLTPFARDEFELSYLTDADPVEQARRTICRSFLGFANSLTGIWKTGFGNRATLTGSTAAGSWLNYPDALQAVIERLRGVVIENRPALRVIADFDSVETLFYIDPPYPYETRGDRWAGRAYRHEMSDTDHVALGQALQKIEGMAVVSSYPSALYREVFTGWRRVERTALADGARARVEVLWISPGVDRAIERGRLPLFEQTR